MAHTINQWILPLLILLGTANAEDVIQLSASLEFPEPVITVHFKPGHGPYGLWIVQQSDAIHIFNREGRREATITASPKDVVIVSPSCRYFALITILPDKTASAAGQILSARVFHHTGSSLYHHTVPFNSVFSRPHLVLTDNGSLVHADLNGSAIREVYDETVLNKIDLSRLFPDWRAGSGLWLSAVTPDLGYYVVSSIVDSVTGAAAARVAAVSPRLKLLSRYQLSGRPQRLFPLTGQGNAWLAFEVEEGITQLALLGRDSVIVKRNAVPQAIYSTGDPGRALFMSRRGFQIMNWQDGMIETGYIPQGMDRVITAAFLPGVEGYLVLYGRQRLQGENIRYGELRMDLVNKVGEVWLTRTFEGEMKYLPAITLIDDKTVSVKTDHQVDIYTLPIQLPK
ncbi:MAG: hypothetical protein K9N11_03675 [Lentisphaeria bacterium]|nr:hypothetical protein [Candidatus Neomarinimicrobiota bacterium]MCF7841934.1 hypothetical protein [Lentisphaeria bacterium]